MGNITDTIARNLRQPESGPVGFYVKRLLKRNNCLTELTAVRLSEIQADHKVLEIGFGPGVGIKAAYQCIKDGRGQVFGVEISEAMLKEAEGEMQSEIQDGRVCLTVASVESMPYEDNTFDRIFHCNCYYFWDDFHKAATELYRVMKPGAKMVTTLIPNGIKTGEERGWLKYGRGDPTPYMEALQAAGFSQVRMEPVADGMEVIYACVENKH